MLCFKIRALLRFLSFFAEIVYAEMSGNMCAAALFDGTDHQNKSGDEERQHIIECVGEGQNRFRHIELEHTQRTKYERTEYGVMRLPCGEDNESYRYPAKSANVIAYPNAAVDYHRAVGTAYSADAAANDDVYVFQHNYLYSGSIGRGGIFAYCTNVKAGFGAIEVVAAKQSDNYSDINKTDCRRRAVRPQRAALPARRSCRHASER